MPRRDLVITVVAITLVLIVIYKPFGFWKRTVTEKASDVSKYVNERVGMVWDRDVYGKGSFKAQRSELDGVGEWKNNTQETKAANVIVDSKEMFGNDQWVIAKRDE